MIQRKTYSTTDQQEFFDKIKSYVDDICSSKSNKKNFPKEVCFVGNNDEITHRPSQLYLHVSGTSVSINRPEKWNYAAEICGLSSGDLWAAKSMLEKMTEMNLKERKK